jgi:hypothetical protein
MMAPENRETNYSFQRLDLWAPCILVGLGILFFSDTLFTGRSFYFRDILNFHYALRRVLVDSWARWEFPLWNPFIYLGQPMLANPNYLAFYPTNLLHLILPFNFAFKLHFIIHALMAGPGLYLLQRRLSIHPLAALGGALAYQFSGTLLSFLNLYNILPAVALLPWIAWAYCGALRGEWQRRSLVFGSLLAIQVVALEPLMFLCNILLLAVLTLHFLAFESDRGKAAIRAGYVAATGTAFAAGLAAIQILPTLEMIPRAVRGSGIDFEYVSRWSFHPIDFLNVIIPNLFGNPFSIGYATSWGERYHHGDLGVLVSFFAGTAVVLTALLSFNSARKSLQRTLLLGTTVAVLLALGRFNPLYHWMYGQIPGMNLGRYPSKYFLLAALLLCILSALGLESLFDESVSKKKRDLSFAVGALAVLAGIILSAASIHWTLHPESLQAWIRSQVDPQQLPTKDFKEIIQIILHSLRSSGAFLIMGSALIFLAPFWKRPAAISGLWLILITAELFPAGLSTVPLISGADVDFTPEIESFILANRPNEPFRVVPPNWLPPVPNRLQAPNRSLAWVTLYYRMTGQTMGGIPKGIQYSIDGSIDMLNTAESEELYRRCLLLPEAQRVQFMKKLNSPVVLSIGPLSHPDLMGLASFDTRSEYRFFAYGLSHSLPRAYMAYLPVRAASHADALERMLRPDGGYPPEVILEDFPVGDDSSQAGTGRVRILNYESRRVVCEAETSAQGYLVLLDSFYPGWKALVDGKETAILRANYAFRAIAMEAGKHRVEFVFNPSSFYLGLGITLLTLTFGIAALGWTSVRKK